MAENSGQGPESIPGRGNSMWKRTGMGKTVANLSTLREQIWGRVGEKRARGKAWQGEGPCESVGAGAQIATL